MIPSIKNDVMATALMTFCRMYDQMEDMREEIKNNQAFIEHILKKGDYADPFLPARGEKVEKTNG